MPDPRWQEIERQPNGWRTFLVDHVHPLEPSHPVLIPDEAIENRKQLYNLATDLDAIEHIMWEHKVRLDPAAEPPAAIRGSFVRAFGPGFDRMRGRRPDGR